MKWDEYFISMAYFVAMKSKDDSTKVGAIIVGPDKEIRSTGYNGIPRGLQDDDPARNDRPEKYMWYEHAERNAIYNACRMGISTNGCTLYTTCFPCSDCARAIIQSGIDKMIFHDSGSSLIAAEQHWTDQLTRAKAMLAGAGVGMRIYEGQIVSKITGLVGGETIDFDVS